MSLFYLPADFPQSFRPFVRDVFDTYDNLNIFIDRNPELPFTQAGRNEDMDTSVEIDKNIREYFRNEGIDCHHIMAGDGAVIQAFSAVYNHNLKKSFPAPVCKLK